MEVPALKTSEIIGDAPQGITSSDIRKKVINAREAQKYRFLGSNIHCNSQMSSKLIKKHCTIGDGSKRLLQSAIDRLGFSARAYDKILKVSRTIADLESSPEIEQKHVAEAIQYRNFDRQI